ncbi:MAG: YwaF family protein [Romboutsia sp.]
MAETFFFSTDHLIVLVFFSLFLCICPKLTKNLLPYSHLVEKVICVLIVSEIVLEQLTLITMKQYDVLSSLPIGVSRFAAYMCILILIFKQSQLYNVFYSWTLVSCIGELIFFKDMGCRFPNFIYFLYIGSKCLLIYANVYMSEVRKFRISKFAIRDNIIMCLLYFSFIVLLNILTKAHYDYSFSTYNILSIFIFMILTTIIYIPSYLSDKDDFRLIKKRTK